MTFKKETFIFLASLALILIIGYINVVMSNKDDFDTPVFDDAALLEKQEEFADMLSDSTDTSNSSDISGMSDITDIITVASNDESVDVSFENFKISKAKNNLEIVDQIEKTLSNDTISEATKQKFEELLVTKNNQIQMENNLEIMLQSKGFDDFVCVVSNNSVKVITNRDIEKADANKILDIVISETKYGAQQIKIVKFNNKEL